MAVRKDLSHPQQVVQACHAVIEAAHSTPPETGEHHPNVIVCAVRDERRLLSLAGRLARDGIAFQVFREPDIGGQATALATETVRGDRRRAFRNLHLLSANEDNDEGGRTMETKQGTQGTTGQGTFETRWGHVAYSYDDYLKLKRLHKIWFGALRAAKRWERWVRKAPHNRVTRRTLRDAGGRKIGREVVGAAAEPRTCDLFSRKLVDTDRKPIGNEYGWFTGWIATDDTVAAEYRKAKHPKATPEEVGPAGLTSREIDAMLADAEDWLAG